MTPRSHLSGSSRGLRRRRSLLVLATLVALLAGPVGAPPALAAGDSVAKARDELAQSRTVLDQALAAARTGDRAKAQALARTAYLDHFEFAEVPLRLRDPNLTLDTEFQFATLRNDIRSGAPVSQLASDVRVIRARLDRAERALSSAGYGAPAIAFGYSFSILFREGVEAVLLIAILLGSLDAGRAKNYRRPLSLGIVAALFATAVTWVLATLVIDIAPVNRELLEAITALAAVGVLALVSFWLISRLEHRHWMEFMRARVAAAIATGSAVAFAGLGFTAVYREGFETVLFYQALSFFAAGLTLWVVLGAVTAIVALGAIAYAILKLGRRLPLKPMLITSASILLLLSVAFVGNAVRSLQEADKIAVTPVSSSLARPPIFIAELTGIHPTQQGLLAQLIVLLVYVAGGLYMFAWRPLRRRLTTAQVAE
jgi:high-affinity iron transporter